MFIMLLVSFSLSNLVVIVISYENIVSVQGLQ